MDVIPQATPLYATVAADDRVYLVIGWRLEVDGSDEFGSPLTAPIGELCTFAEYRPEASIYLTIEEAQAALLSR